MIRRAVALSLLAHTLLLGAIAWRIFSRPREAKLEIAAPIGEVFAQEGKRPAVPAKTAAAEISAAGKAPTELAGGSPSPAGVPDGDAQPIGEIHPGYPAISRRLGEEGESVFIIQISPDGHVAGLRLEHSSGHDRLDEAARTALLAARFVGDQRGGMATKRFHVEFRLR